MIAVFILYYLSKCILTEILSLAKNDIDRDISLGENDIDRDISLPKNDIDREGQQQDKSKIKYFLSSQNLPLLLQRYPLFS